MGPYPLPSVSKFDRRLVGRLRKRQLDDGRGGGWGRVVPNHIARKSGPLEIEIIQYSLAMALLRDVANSRDVFLLCGVFFAPFLSLHILYCRKKNKIGTEIECIIL